MRIIKQPTQQEKETKVTCPRCGTVFAYENDDITFDQRDGNFVKCPTCGYGCGAALKPDWTSR